MSVEFSAVRREISAGDEETRRTLRDEIRAGDEETRRTLRDEIRAGDEETRRTLRDEIRAGDDRVVETLSARIEDARRETRVLQLKMRLGDIGVIGEGLRCCRKEWI